MILQNHQIFTLIKKIKIMKCVFIDAQHATMEEMKMKIIVLHVKQILFSNQILLIRIIVLKNVNIIIIILY